jgi:hypothetical protein
VVTAVLVSPVSPAGLKSEIAAYSWLMHGAFETGSCQMAPEVNIDQICNHGYQLKSKSMSNLGPVPVAFLP